MMIKSKTAKEKDWQKKETKKETKRRLRSGSRTATAIG